MKWEEDEDKDYVIMTKEDGTSSSSGSQEAEEDEECPKVLLDTESNVSRLWFSFTTFLSTIAKFSPNLFSFMN